MCGIAGCKLKRPLTPDDLAVMRGLRGGLSHRGPDDKGEWYDMQAGIYLGHRRLSIIDLDKRSAQPMERGGARIVFNGEIYNYREIRDTLAPHHQFTTQGDTEVILRGWQTHGADILPQCDGMFAFALHDGHALYLATDAFGEKPLYYYETKDGFYFASEARALIDAFSLAFAPEQSDLQDFLYLGYIRPPVTGFPGLCALPPACLLTLDGAGGKNITTWWRPEMPTAAGSSGLTAFSAQEVDQLRDLLCRSLELRLRADVPAGLFLSGGVDSALLAALARCELGLDLKAFTVAFPDGEDESIPAQKIAGHLGLDHQVIDSAAADLWRDMPAALAHFYGVPNDNTTVFALHQMCVLSKPHLTVAISGLGGDELFYGYNKYATLYANRRLYRHAPLLQPLLKMAARFHPRLATAADMTAGSSTRQYLRVKNGAALRDMTALLDMPGAVIADDKDDLVHKVRMFDLQSSMPQSYIPAVDRGSMRAAVEVRAPFLNRALFDFVCARGRDRLIHHGQKAFAKDLLARYMPLDYLTKGKQGFKFPVSRYLTQENLSPPAPGMLDAAAVEGFWQKRNDPAYQPILLRLMQLSYMLAGGARDE